jgi:hypothetical protein
VYLSLRAGVARHAIHPIRCRALVRDRHVARAGLDSLRRSASPWLSDVDRADVIIGSLRSNSAANERQSCREKVGDEPRRWPRFSERSGHVFLHRENAFRYEPIIQTVGQRAQYGERKRVNFSACHPLLEEGVRVRNHFTVPPPRRVRFQTSPDRCLILAAQRSSS